MGAAVSVKKIEKAGSVPQNSKLGKIPRTQIKKKLKRSVVQDGPKNHSGTTFSLA